jgi:membrane dipeptidase
VVVLVCAYLRGKSGIFPARLCRLTLECLMPTPPATFHGPWFDAHLDLPYLALHGRDMRLPIAQATGGEMPAALTFHSMKQGDVRWVLGTIFINPGMPEAAYGYRDSSDVELAHARGASQMQLYQAWEKAGDITIVRSQADLADDGPGAPVKVIVLMEGADPIRTPAEADWWFEQGLRVCSLTWVRGTRYAAGDGMPQGDAGLSDMGRELIKAFDRLGVIHDLSHLSDRSAHELLSISKGPVIASHSASRTLQADGRMRHISDDLARQISRRGGVVGLPLYTRFLGTSPARASIARTCDHLDHLASVMGRRSAVALGSDLDGGFSGNDLPEGISSPSDFGLLSHELQSRGWSRDEVAGFERENWLSFFRKHLRG